MPPLLALAHNMSSAVSGAAFGLCQLAQSLSGPLWGKTAAWMPFPLVIPLLGCRFSLAVRALAVIRLSALP